MQGGTVKKSLLFVNMHKNPPLNQGKGLVFGEDFVLI